MITKITMDFDLVVLRLVTDIERRNAICG